MTTKRFAILVGVLVVGVVVIYLARQGNAPTQGGSEGAIGAANRHSEQQLANKDVVLQDADVQAFLQSDLFHKMTIDPEFRRVVTSEAFRSLAQDDGLFKVLRMEADLRKALCQDDVLSLFQDAEYQRLSADEAYQNVSASREFQQLASTPEFQKCACTQAFGELLQDPEFQKYMSEISAARVSTMEELEKARHRIDPAWGRVVNSVQFKSLMEAEYFKRLMADQVFRQLAATVDMQKAVCNAAFARVIDSVHFRNLVAQPQLLKALCTAEVHKALHEDAVMKALNSVDFRNLARSADFQRLMERHEAAKFFETAALEKAWHTAEMQKALSKAMD